MKISEDINMFGDMSNYTEEIPILNQTTSPIELYNPSTNYMLPKIVKNNSKHIRQMQNQA